MGFLDRASDRVAVCFGLDEVLAHELQGGADFLLMPSLYEPCGLGQIYAMKAGTVPVVRATGGLVDTVTDDTGFLFSDYHPGALVHTVRRAAEAYRAGWTGRMRACMRQDFSWNRSAREYLTIFEQALS
jgi:starch synthase